jgi:hypothetical protein
MTSFSVEGLRAAGFRGFTPLVSLDLDRVIVDGGVYVVLRDSVTPAEFVEVSVGGHFKGKDPSVPIAVLSARWSDRSPVVYIGKATSLRKRLREFRNFGQGKRIGHWGGRYIWQMADASHLLVCWQPTSEVPREVEQRMLAEFQSEYGTLPFANLSQ